MSGLLEQENDSGVLDGYVAFRIQRSHASKDFLEDLDGFFAAENLAFDIRNAFEHACGGAEVYGPLGNWNGVLSNEPMPNYWRASDETVAPERTVWKPNGHHPLGKWLDDVASRMMGMPPPEILDAILRRHALEGSKEPVPCARRLEDGDFALLVHKPKTKAFKVMGVTEDKGLLKLWSPRLATTG